MTGQSSHGSRLFFAYCLEEELGEYIMDGWRVVGCRRFGGDQWSYTVTKESASVDDAVPGTGSYQNREE